MRVLIACEFSGVVREAFRARGHDAWSCDLLPAEDGSPHHYEGDIFPAIMHRPWDMMIAHPPCTYLANSGVRWLVKDGKFNPVRMHHMQDAIWFWRQLRDAPIQRIAIENPIPHKHAKVKMGDYTQIIQPWQFGHGETKATCLWLKNLPKLVPTNIVEGRTPRVHHASPGPDRWKERSRTLTGIAEAMADQWGITTPPLSVGDREEGHG